jgi:hypothetical protein
MYEPLRTKILRFVWLNANCYCLVIEDELRRVGIELARDCDCCILYNWAKERWGVQRYDPENQDKIRVKWEAAL